MALTVNMPQLGESVTEGTIARWLKQPGESVAKYESVAEVITDKVNAEIPAPADGTMGEIVAPEGTVVAVGEPICRIETNGTEAVAAAPQPAEAETPREPDSEPEPIPAAQSPAPAPTPVAKPNQSATPAPDGGSSDGFHLTPAVRMLVREHDVDLEAVRGSGIGGRITKKDVLEYVQQRDSSRPAASQPKAQAPAAVRASPEPPATAVQPAADIQVEGPGDTVVALTPGRRAIADHMVRSRRTSPHAWVMVEVDMSAVVRLRDARKADFKQRHGISLTYLPFVARATIEGLRGHPSLNAQWSDQGIVIKQDIHLGIAVALEDNLVVPVVRHADRLSIVGLAEAMAGLGERARGNRLKLDEIQGGTFTLNNTGALGTVMTQAIINQPQAAIMTMDAVIRRPVVVNNDQIAIRPVMNLGLSFDHRLNDGLQATRFLTDVKTTLERLNDNGSLL